MFFSHYYVTLTTTVYLIPIRIFILEISYKVFIEMIHNVTSKLGCVLCCLRYCMWKITEIIRRSWHLTIPPSSFAFASLPVYISLSSDIHSPGENLWQSEGNSERKVRDKNTAYLSMAFLFQTWNLKKDENLKIQGGLQRPLWSKFWLKLHLSNLEKQY